jgi:hypothetical protein
MTTVADYWDELVTTALLGTDRREPPVAPVGGLGDLAADAALRTASQQLLQQVAATVAVRRAGLLPAAPVALPAPPEPDQRPPTPAAASATWRRVVEDWAVLEDEWVLAVLRQQWRLSPDLVPALLARHRSDGTRHARVRLAAGPLADWMIDWSPRLACVSKQRVVPELLAELPELPITPDLVSLLAAPTDRVVSVLCDGLVTGRLAVGLRPILVNLVARVQPVVLPALAEHLRRLTTSTSNSLGLAYSLADLAQLRHQMLTELEPA